MSSSSRYVGVWKSIPTFDLNDAIEHPRDRSVHVHEHRTPREVENPMTLLMYICTRIEKVLLLLGRRINNLLKLNGSCLSATTRATDSFMPLVNAIKYYPSRVNASSCTHHVSPWRRITQFHHLTGEIDRCRVKI